jgi:hypothetical protein
MPPFGIASARHIRITSKSEVSEFAYNEMALTGSKALYFTASSDANETWKPLLEKAYARMHGDYGSIQDLYVGDVLEDSTGGVSWESGISVMLDKDLVWRSLLKIRTMLLPSPPVGILG